MKGLFIEAGVGLRKLTLKWWENQGLAKWEVLTTPGLGRARGSKSENWTPLGAGEVNERLRRGDAVPAGCIHCRKCSREWNKGGGNVLTSLSSRTLISCDSATGQVPLASGRQETQSLGVPATTQRAEVSMEEEMQMQMIQQTWPFSFQRSFCPFITSLDVTIQVIESIALLLGRQLKNLTALEEIMVAAPYLT